MITIHHLNRSRSERIVWLAEELGLPYRLVRHQRDPLTMRAPQSLWAINPVGKAPCVEDGEVKLWESGAIVEYIIEKYGDGRLRPAVSDPSWPNYLRWMHGAESTLMLAPMVDFLTKMTGAGSDLLTGFVGGEYATVMGQLNSEVEAHPFIAGDSFTGADIMVAFTLRMMDMELFPGSGLALQIALKDFPAAKAYLDRLFARPAWQRTLAAIGE